MKLKAYIALIIVVLTVVFSLQNNSVTDILFLTWKISLPISALILCVFSIGLIVGILMKKNEQLIIKRAQNIL